SQKCYLESRRNYGISISTRPSLRVVSARILPQIRRLSISFTVDNLIFLEILTMHSRATQLRQSIKNGSGRCHQHDKKRHALRMNERCGIGSFETTWLHHICSRKEIGSWFVMRNHKS